VFDLRIVKYFGQVVDGRVWDVVGFQSFQPVRARLFPKNFAEGLAQLVVILSAVRAGLETRIFDQVRALSGVAQTFPEFLRRGEMNRERQTIRTAERISLRLPRASVRTRRPAVR
jgi:hypothetical protein